MPNTEPEATHELDLDVFRLGRGRESRVLLLKELKHQVGQMVMNLDTLVEVVKVEPQ